MDVSTRNWPALLLVALGCFSSHVSATSSDAPSVSASVLVGSAPRAQLESAVPGLSDDSDNADAFSVTLNLLAWQRGNRTGWYELYFSQQSSDLTLRENKLTLNRAPLPPWQYSSHSRYLMVGGTVEAGETLKPYFTLLVGATQFGVDGDSDRYGLSAAMALGVKWFPVTYLGLQLDARATASRFRDSDYEMCDGDCTFNRHGQAWFQPVLSAGVVARF